jgi:hypothetical protein
MLLLLLQQLLLWSYVISWRPYVHVDSPLCACEDVTVTKAVRKAVVEPSTLE